MARVPVPWPEWDVNAWSSPSEAKWPRTAASTSRAGVPGFSRASPAAIAPEACLEQLALAGRRPAADGERVGEVAPVAGDDDREVEQEQVARLDLAATSAGRLCRDRTRGPGGEVAIDDRLLAERRARRLDGRSGRRRARVMPGRTSARAAACAASPARIERRRVSTSSGSFDRRSGRISGPMSTISSPGRARGVPRPAPPARPPARRRPARPGIFASRSSAESHELAPAVGGRMVSVVPGGRDPLVDERALDERPEHVVGDQRRPARLEQEQGPRLDRPEHERRRHVAGEVDQVRRVAHDQDVALRRQAPPRAARDARRILRRSASSSPPLGTGDTNTPADLPSGQLEGTLGISALHRAEPPLASASTSSSLAMVTSPGKVVRSGAVGPAEAERFLGRSPGDQAVDQAGGEAVAAADAVEDVELAGRADVPLAVEPEHGRPGVAVGRMDLAQGRRRPA